MSMKYIISIVVLVCLVSAKFIFNLFESEKQEVVEENIYKPVMPDFEKIPKKDHYVDDSLYAWNDSLFDWEFSNLVPEFDPPIDTSGNGDSDVIVLDWQDLMDIKYRLKYFAEIDLKIYSPVFSNAVKKLDKKEVIIEGFVIPFDEEEELLSLSMNPFAACFFCGNASPASVISLYLKDTKKRYKVDDYKKFRGILHLNQDDPNEFYYILKEAREYKG